MRPNPSAIDSIMPELFTSSFKTWSKFCAHNMIYKKEWKAFSLIQLVFFKKIINGIMHSTTSSHTIKIRFISISEDYITQCLRNFCISGGLHLSWVSV